MAGELSKEELNKKIKNSIKNLQDLKSGDLKTLPKSEKQIKNKGKKKLQDAYENNIDDLPRGLQIDTTTGEGANITEEEIMVPKKKPVKAFMGLGVELMKKAKDSGAKGLEFLSPLAMVNRIAKGKKNTTTVANTESISQKKTGVAKLSTGGDVTVGKGGDYIKDLID